MLDSFPPEQSNQAAAENEPRLLTRRPVPDDEPKPSPRRVSPVVARKPTRLGRRIVFTLLTMALVVVVGVLVFALVLRHGMRAALPQLDGTLHIAGLAAPVTVTRDAQGVPSIHAANVDDLLTAQDYITAQDRLWQMDALRRHAAGDLAELLGPSLVDHDRQQRTLQLRNTADAAVTAMPADQRHALECYARGVNAYIATHKDKLPVEFTLLHYTPAAWQPRDSMLVLLAMWQDLSTVFPSKLNREALSAHLPEGLMNDLYAVGSFRDHPPSAAEPDLTTPKQVDEIPLDSTQSSLRATPEELTKRFASVGREFCDGCRSGSNNWAVSAERSATGAPLVSNDMHLNLAVPDIWYEAALHTPGHNLDVTGFTMPGLPFVLAGRNAHVAWGITALGGDTQDVYIEHLRGSGDTTEFERPDGSWADVTHHHELIRVRGGHDVTLDVLTTVHPLGSKQLPTPIISGLYPHEGRALSLAWTAYDAASLPLPLEAVDTAASGQSLVAAASTMGGPTLNLVYADDQKHIGYHAIGEIPVRGPAEKHPRMLPQLGMPGTVPPGDPNQTSEPEAEPEASLTIPGFTLAAYHPQRRAAPPARARAKPKGVAKPEPVAPVEDVPPAPPVIDYTIGAPIPQVPVDALNAAAQWSGVIPYDQLPQVVDPPSGVIVTANSRVTPDDYPYAVTQQWYDAFRTERLYHLLNGRTGLTPADMLHTEMDVHSEFDFFLAERLAYAVDHASPAMLKSDGKRLHAAADLLRDFKGEMRGDDAAPAITSAVRPELWNALLAPQVWKHDHMRPGDKAAYPIGNLYTWISRTSVLETLLNHEPARWLPPGEKNWDDFLTGVLEAALQRAHAPADVMQWKYGQMYPIELAHPLLTNPLMARLLGVQTGSGKRAGNGSPFTVDASYGHFGPSERFTADLSNPEATIANVTTGQSGNPASGHYLDQLEAWLTGRSFALPLQHPEAAHTLTLEP